MNKLDRIMKELGKNLEKTLKEALPGIFVTKQIGIENPRSEMIATGRENYIFEKKDEIRHVMYFLTNINVGYRMRFKYKFEGDVEKMKKTARLIADWMDLHRWNKDHAGFIIYRNVNKVGWVKNSDRIEIFVPAGFEYIGREEDELADYIPSLKGFE